MTDAELIELVRQMRTNQKHYFKHRDTKSLNESMSIERTIDTELKRRDDNQPSLF